MKRTLQLATAALTYTAAFEVFAQTAASVPMPPPSGASSSTNPGAPGGGVTWLLAGLVIGIIVGYFIGKSAADKARAAST